MVLNSYNKKIWFFYFLNILLQILHIILKKNNYYFYKKDCIKFDDFNLFLTFIQKDKNYTDWNARRGNNLLYNTIL